MAATLARGLIEQAAYWDWALATGVGVGHLAHWAALELQGLSRLAEEIDDRVWLGWLMPPGAAVEVPAGPALPGNPDDAVRRIGSGLDDAVLDPLRFDGLLSAYRVLDVLAHGNYVGAAILANQPDQQLPDRLAAVATHLAAAGATAVAYALAEDGTHLDAVATQFKLVTAAACATHGLPPQSPTTTRRPRRPARARWTPQMNATASAQRMPPIPPELTRLGLAFLAAADDLAEVVVSDTSWAMIPGSWIPAQTTITDPAVLAAELERVRVHHNSVRLHEAIGYVTPNDEHDGRGDTIRAARTDGMRNADEQRRAWHRSQR